MFINFYYELKLSPHLQSLGCGLDLMTCFQRTEIWKGKNSTFITKKSGRHHLNQPIKENTSNVMLTSITPWNDVIRTLHLCNICPQNPQPYYNHGGNIRQPKLKSILQNIWAELFKVVKVMKNNKRQGN